MITLKNATVIEFSPPTVREHVDIIIEGPFITEVRENSTMDPDRGAAEQETVIDCTGKIVWPGLVCSHNHFYSGLARGVTAAIGATPDFISTLKQLWWKMDNALDKEVLHSCSLISALEAVKAGTTAVIDHHASQSFIRGSLDTVRKGYEKAGLRGITCFEVSDRAGADALREGVEENISFAEKVNTGEAGPVRGMIGGHAPFTLPDSALALLADAVEKTDTGVHLHAAEDRYDVSHSHHHYGKDLLARLNDFGLLNEKALIVHGLFLSHEDIALLNDHDSFLVHNVRSNMNNGVGYNRLLPEVKNVALGTDGIGSNMYEEFKFAFFGHRNAGGLLGPDDFLSFLYNGNTILERSFHLPFGRVARDYAADLVISDYDAPTPLTGENIAGHLAYGMAARDVETVIINGNLVYENRTFPFDTAPIYREARKAALRLWKKMDGME
jgi:putative selenium metabolism protein SsnA